MKKIPWQARHFLKIGAVQWHQSLFIVMSAIFLFFFFCCFQAPAHVLYCWSNGFTIDDGPLRTGQSPEDRQFMESVSKG